MVENYWQLLSPASLLMNESLHRQPGKYVWLIKWRKSCAKEDGLMQQELDLPLTPCFRSPENRLWLIMEEKSSEKSPNVLFFFLFLHAIRFLLFF